MELFNPTPQTIKARAEGVIYIIDPGEIVKIPEGHRAETILNNFGQMGLRAVAFGDDIDEIRADGLAVWCENIKTQVRNLNQHQLDQARQGLKPAPPNRVLEDLVRMVNKQTGDEIKLDIAEGDEDPMLAVIRNLAKAVKGMKDDAPEREQLSALLEKLAKTKAEKGEKVEEERLKILDAETINIGQTAAAKAGRAARVKSGKPK